ncbi:MAG TPA: glycerophosphodiester phosphodiesterase family protein [Methanotrichaceae archaeon]|nr:glycerophosphodiester phosphodiesterase family protein [Methanotrichaceae archaeon]HQI91359.1 glycerophosphodiester phosphodiesterase family protein [Methanotrichaceae archaeon]HQJ28675.1 glycerophosphodiester phosphodiesterase family protein [Methanotrichaceae archaeon]
MPYIIGHRGARAMAPENTLKGLRAAFDCGAELAEVDVRLSSDGCLVLMHDETVDRTTGGQGRIEDLTLDDLKALSVGGEPIPTLQDALSLAEAMGRSLVVEMKEEGLEELMLEALTKCRQQGSIVASFYHNSLLDLRELWEKKRHGEQLHTGIVIASLPIRPIDLAESARADMIFPARVSSSLFKAAHRQGIRVFPWIVNQEDQAAWLIKLGADGLVTDYPCRLRAVASAPPSETGKENCRYYPCHHFGEQDCTHCFCPLYPCRDDRLGKFVRTRKGKRVWTCIDCRLVHIPLVARYLSDNPGAKPDELMRLVPEGCQFGAANDAGTRGSIRSFQK